MLDLLLVCHCICYLILDYSHYLCYWIEIMLLSELLLTVLLEMLVSKMVSMLMLQSLEFVSEFEISRNFWFFARCTVKNNGFNYLDEMIGSFPSSYWISTLCLVVMFCTVITWNDSAVIELYSKYNGLMDVVSSNLVSWVIIEAIFTLIFGLIANRIGYKCILISISGIFLSIAYIWIYVLFQTDTLIMIVLVLCLGFGMFAAAVFLGVAIDLGFSDHSGLNLIHYTCQHGDLALFNCLVSTTPKLKLGHNKILNMRPRNAYEVQSIYFVSRNNNQSIINKLLLFGIGDNNDDNTGSDNDHNTPIDINSKNKNASTLVSAVCEYGLYSTENAEIVIVMKQMLMLELSMNAI